MRLTPHPLAARCRMMHSMRAKRLKTYLLVTAAYLLIWEALHLIVGSELLLPSPAATVSRFLQLLGSAESWRNVGLTLLRIMSGYLLGVIAGVLLAALSAALPFAETMLSPLRSIVKATPVTSFILLALLWLTSGMVPLFIAFLMVLPMIWTSTLTAILQTDRQLLEMARVFRLSRTQILMKIYVPSVLPQALAACTTALGFAWKSGVAAEIIALPKASVGYQLYRAKLTIETVDLFAWTLLVVILSMLLEALLVHGMRRLRHD